MKVRSVTICSVALVLLFLMAGMAASASGKEVHIFSSKFGAGELSLTGKSGVAINQETGVVYVADTGNGRIVRYSANGESLGTFAAVTEPTFMAVDNSPGTAKGDIYVVEQATEVVAKYNPSGAPVTTWGTAGRLEGFGKIAGIAVDPSGNVFVLGTNSVVHEFDPLGSPSSQCTVSWGLVPNFPTQNGLAVDSTDNLYFSHGPNQQAAKITSDCQLTSREFGAGWGEEKSGFAIDEADNSVYISRIEELQHLTSNEGKLESHIGKEEGLVSPAQLAVRNETGTLYAAEPHGGYVTIFTIVNVEPPHLELFGPSNVTGTTAQFRAAINPEAPESDPPAYNVNYSFHCIPGCSGTGLSGTVPAGAQLVERSATAEHLLPGTEYKVYVTGENVGGIARAPEEPEEGLAFQTLVIAPSISEEVVTDVSDTTMTLSAVVAPGGTETGYDVQYVTKAQYEASGFTNAEETQSAVVTGAEGITVTQTAMKLNASTSYVARMVAANTVGEVFGDPVAFATQEPSVFAAGCGNEVFRIGAGAHLPDCRAYELVSPSDKNGGSVEAVPGAVQAPAPAVPGEGEGAVTFFSEAGIPGGSGAQDYPTFISTRAGGAWSTQGLLPPQSLGEFGDFLGLTPDGRFAITEATLRGEGTGVFVRDLSDGKVTTVIPYNAGCGGKSKCFTLAGASASGSMIFLETQLELDNEPPTTVGARNVYAWDRETGAISLVGVNESGGALPEGAVAGPFDWANGNLNAGGAREHYYVGAINGVSSNGSEIVYTEKGGHGQLYVRLGLGGASPHSRKVSAYASGQSGPELPAAFLEATPEGQFIFFKSKAELTSDSYSGEGGESLYRYDVANSQLIDITSEAKEKFQAGPEVEGMLGSSESGQVVYFVAKAKLTAKPGPNGKVAVLGEANLYRWEEGASSPVSFIATLQGGPLGSGSREGLESDSRDWSPSVVEPGNEANYTAKTARVDAEGNVVAFSSRRSLTGAPNLSRACDASGEEKLAPCAEFFRYSAASKTLVCVSCNPTGARPLNGATIGTGYINAADSPSVLAEPALSRNLSADGDRFFFQTPDSLVAADGNRSGCTATTNEKEKCLDVYEWEAVGSGSCSTATINGGCLYLISGGEGEEASYFADADREGKNVYFFTASRLLPDADRDQLYDVYDASEGGGLPSQNEGAPAGCGSQQSCQGQQVGAEEGTSPATLGFVGPENPKPKGCKKGFVRNHGKCVKKPKKRAAHHKNRRKAKKQTAKGSTSKQKGRVDHNQGGGK